MILLLMISMNLMGSRMTHNYSSLSHGKMHEEAPIYDSHPSPGKQVQGPPLIHDSYDY